MVRSLFVERFEPLRGARGSSDDRIILCEETPDLKCALPAIVCPYHDVSEIVYEILTGIVHAEIVSVAGGHLNHPAGISRTGG